MKRFLAMLLALTMTASLAACSSPGGGIKGTAGSGNDTAGSDYPSKGMEVIVPYKVGGTTDLAVRGVLDAIPKEVIDQQITVTNKEGGSGLIGTEDFLRRNADGYTLGLVNCDLVLNYVSGATDINPTEAFIPLAAVEQDPYLLLASKDAPFTSFAEFVSYAEAHPGELVVGVTGVGTVPNLLGSILTGAGLQVSSVPYDSAPDAIAGVLSGEVSLCISAMAPAVGNIDSGDLVPIAVTSAERSTASPDIPTMAETDDRFANVNLLSWIMIAAPAGTPDDIVSFQQEALSEAVASDQYAETREGFYFEPITIGIDELAGFIAEQSDYYTTLVG